MAAWLLPIGSTYKCPYMSFLMLMLTQDGKPSVYEQHGPRCWCVHVCVCLSLLTKWYISKTMVSKWYSTISNDNNNNIDDMNENYCLTDGCMNKCLNLYNNNKNQPAQPHTRINIGHIGRWGWQNLSKSLRGKFCMYIYGLFISAMQLHMFLDLKIFYWRYIWTSSKFRYNLREKIISCNGKLKYIFQGLLFVKYNSSVYRRPSLNSLLSIENLK